MGATGVGEDPDRCSYRLEPKTLGTGDSARNRVRSTNLDSFHSARAALLSPGWPLCCPPHPVSPFLPILFYHFYFCPTMELISLIFLVK